MAVASSIANMFSCGNPQCINPAHILGMADIHAPAPQSKSSENTDGAPEKISDWVAPGDKSGEFKRKQSVFRDFISSKAGAKFPPEKGRYHLYVSYACPWGKPSHQAPILSVPATQIF